MASDQCTWVQTRLPEFDEAGRRVTRTDWSRVVAELRGMGLSSPDAAQRTALGTPLSGRPDALTALGAAVDTIHDNRIGSRDVMRLARISLVQITPNLLISARHRDGLVWVDPVELAQMPDLRGIAEQQRDRYRPTGLLTRVITNDRVDAWTRSDELAIEVIFAVSQAFPRAVLDKLRNRLSLVEESLASTRDLAHPDRSGDVDALSDLLNVIAAVGRLEQEVSVAVDDLEMRTRGRGWVRIRDDAAEVGKNIQRILEALARIRGDARTTVDMIGSTRASAHLRIAEEQRQAESGEREREARLARTITLLTSALLIPTLVASVFGANVHLPREGTHWETWLMFASMIGLGSLSLGLLNELDSTKKTPKVTRFAPFAVAILALGAALAIATGGLGTG